jgi:hypothetical protein
MPVSGVPSPRTTATAAACGRVALSPSWPDPFAPQHHTLPPARTAHACSRPAPIATASVTTALVESRASMRTALGTPAIPNPSWPFALSPAHRTVRSCASTQPNRRPNTRSEMHAAHVPLLQYA